MIIWNLLIKLFEFLTHQTTKPMEPQSSQPNPQNSVPTPTSVSIINSDALYPSWSDPIQARHNVRALCDLAGLIVTEKNVITAVVEAESGFLNYYIAGPNQGKPVSNQNLRADGSLSSTDWGICQINDRYHIGPDKDFPSVQYVLENPQAAVEWMIKMYKAGQIDMWCAFTSGSYKKYLV